MERLSQFNGNGSENWEGYTLEELRYHRALNLARRELVSQQLKTLATDVANGSAITSNNRTILSKITSSLSYIDYGIMAFTIVSRIRKMFYYKK
ncbi:MAG: hypothetical protein K2O12_02900 [Muribaculaceae bacterium]|nr:hypothetical protein [Muribaculaceae bacterium]